ncbi:shikimate kinase [Candidatus Leptofilum sp.]|uniref:shikimate kinase n=1 Tax=Candidatus Leptofilum sp. TaxID=3241576 RepID=UPI003B5C45BE
MDSTIILIGPISAGKSSVATLLVEALGCPRISVDDVRWGYYEEIGYDNALAGEIRQSQGITGLLEYWKPFEAHTVVRILADHDAGVIDFGAGHSVYNDEDLFKRVQMALAPYPFVILLLPSPDKNESVAILNGRFVEMLASEGVEANNELLQLNEQFVRHPSNYLLAKHTVYTKDKTPDETCAEIKQWLTSQGYTGL